MEEHQSTTRKQDENDFVKFVDNIKIHKNKQNPIQSNVASKRVPTDESEISPVNSTSLHPRLLNKTFNNNI